MKLARLKLARTISRRREAGKRNPEGLPQGLCKPSKTRGIIALKKKDGLTAVNSFRLLTQDRPQDPQAWLLLARGHLMHKEARQAKETAKKALEIKPDFLEARKFLYSIFLQDKIMTAPIATIQSYLRLNGKDMFNLVTLGRSMPLKMTLPRLEPPFRNH